MTAYETEVIKYLRYIQSDIFYLGVKLEYIMYFVGVGFFLWLMFKILKPYLFRI